MVAVQKIQHIVYSAPCFLSSDDLALLRQTCDALGRHYQWLSVDANQQNKLRWHAAPKYHFTLGARGPTSRGDQPPLGPGLRL